MSSPATWLSGLVLIPLVFAQNTAPGNTQEIANSLFGTSTATPTTTPTATVNNTGTTVTGDPTTATSPSTSTDGASSKDFKNDGLVRVYFIFIALVVIVALLGSFLYYRRRRQMLALAQYSNNRQSALAQDLSNWDPARGRRRYWQGRWRSDNSTVEEGLNENGEAPPPYIPKAQEEGAAHQHQNGPAIPLNTLSRDDAGLKPPDYSEVSITEHAPGSSGSNAGPDSSRRYA